MQAFGREIFRNTVRKYVRAFQESGLSLEVLGMSDEHLYGMFVGGKSRTREPSGRRAELDALPRMGLPPGSGHTKAHTHGLVPLDAKERPNLLDIIGDRHGRK